MPHEPKKPPARGRPAHALAAALGVREPPRIDGPTVDLAGAAALLHTTPEAVRQRRHAGKMPRPLTKKPLVWRVQDILEMDDA
jgi:hypothetical protein